MRRVLKISLATLISIVIMLASGWGIHRYFTYPNAPDVKTAKLDDAVAFMSTDEFNRMLQRDRKRYAMGVVERMREQPFKDLVSSVMKPDPTRKQMAENVKKIDGHEEIGQALYAMFLDRFYQEPPAQRTVYLMMFAGARQSEIAKHPERFGLPTPDKFKADVAKFFARQPPRVQALTGQFLIDLRRQRQMLGMKDPW